MNHKVRPQVKNMHDKKLSFIFLLHLINYKKFKSIKKRFLLCNFNLFRSFLPTLKYSFYYAHKRLWFSQFDKSKTNEYLSPIFFVKRMFGKKNDLLSNLDLSKTKYIFKNGKIFKNLIKNKFFFNNPSVFVNGSVVELTQTLLDLTETNLFLQKGVTHTTDINFNPSIFFNISMLSCVEIYSSITCLYILNCENKNQIN